MTVNFYAGPDSARWTGLPGFELDDDAAQVSDVAATIIAQMPEPQQHAIEQHESQEIAAEASAPRDVDGVAFNDAIHTGSKLKNGRWRARKSAKASASVIGSSGGTKSESSPADPATEARASLELQSRVAAQAATGCTFMVCTALGGKEWQPRVEPIDETSVLNDAYTQYFISKGVVDFPPGIALALALTMYAAPRFTMPETKARASRLKVWIAAKVANWKLKREARKLGLSVGELKKKMSGGE